MVNGCFFTRNFFFCADSLISDNFIKHIRPWIEREKTVECRQTEQCAEDETIKVKTEIKSIKYFY